MSPYDGHTRIRLLVRIETAKGCDDNKILVRLFCLVRAIFRGRSALHRRIFCGFKVQLDQLLRERSVIFLVAIGVIVR